MDCDLRPMHMDQLDDDHEQLLFALQDLAYGAGPEPAAMDRMLALVIEHFDHERPHLARVGGVLETKHLAAHARFLDRLTAIRAHCVAEPDRARGELAEITARFISHTNTDDLAIADALKALAPPPPAAAISLDDILLN